jgi:hypothetical protein
MTRRQKNTDESDRALTGKESDYTADREERERIKRKKNKIREQTPPKKRTKTLELSEVLLPKQGETNVSEDEHDTLNATQKKKSKSMSKSKPKRFA